MHGFGWQMDVFMAFLLYGFTIPVVILWAAMLKFAGVKKTMWEINSFFTHGFALVWIVEVHSNTLMAAGIVMVYIFFHFVLKAKAKKLATRSDLYANEIKVVEPNQIKK